MKLRFSLLILALVPIQTAILVFTFKYHGIVVNLVNSAERGSPNDAVADGGVRAERDESEQKPNTSGFGAVLGILSGAAFGSIFGPAGTIGVAVLGAILGDEYECQKREAAPTVVHRLEG